MGRYLPILFVVGSLQMCLFLQNTEYTNVEEVLEKLKGSGVDARKFENIFGYQHLEPGQSLTSQPNQIFDRNPSNKNVYKLKVASFANNEDSQNQTNKLKRSNSEGKNASSFTGEMKLLRKKYKARRSLRYRKNDLRSGGSWLQENLSRRRPITKK